MNGVILTPLKKIHNLKGDVFHAMRKSDNGFNGFGEAYFSTINKDDIKGWKQHTRMTLNLIVPVGEIEFVIYCDTTKNFLNVRLSQENYQRLSVSAGLWLAFKGLHDSNMLLNIASIEHDPGESRAEKLDYFNYNWGGAK